MSGPVGIHKSPQYVVALATAQIVPGIFLQTWEGGWRSGVDESWIDYKKLKINDWTYNTFMLLDPSLMTINKLMIKGIGILIFVFRRFSCRLFLVVVLLSSKG